MTQEKIEPAHPLASERFFKGVSAEVVARVETFAHQRQYASRQIVFFPDDRCDCVYWVRSGRVKITHVSDNGREVSFRHLFRGDIFGEECLLGQTRRLYYAEALSPTLLTLVPGSDFVRLVREEQELSLALALNACRRAVGLEHMLSDFVFSEVRDRTLRRLWHLYCREQEGCEDALAITHQEMASLVGAARETITGVLHQLRKEKVISLSNKHIEVLDPGLLRQLSGGKDDLSSSL